MKPPEKRWFFSSLVPFRRAPVWGYPIFDPRPFFVKHGPWEF